MWFVVFLAANFEIMLFVSYRTGVSSTLSRADHAAGCRRLDRQASESSAQDFWWIWRTVLVSLAYIYLLDSYCIAYIYSCFGYHIFSLFSVFSSVADRSGSGIRCFFDPWIRDGKKILDPGWILCSTWVVIPFTFTTITSLTKIAKNFTLNIPDLIIENLVSVPEYWFKNA